MKWIPWCSKIDVLESNEFNVLQPALDAPRLLQWSPINHCNKNWLVTTEKKEKKNIYYKILFKILQKKVASECKKGNLYGLKGTTCMAWIGCNVPLDW